MKRSAFILVAIVVAATALSQVGPGWNVFTPGSKALYDVCFVDTLTGWAVGSEGAIFKSTDGGKTWVQQVTVTAKNLNAVHFVSNLIGYAAGNDGVVLRTTNGGEGWSVKITTPAYAWNDIYAASSTEAYVVSEFSASGVWRTTNSGTNWTQVNNRGAFSKLCFLSGSNVWAAGGGEIWHTTDGTNWSNANGNGIANVLCVSFISDSVGFAASMWITTPYNNSIIYKTTNGGATWSPTDTLTQCVISNIQFLSASEGWVSGLNTQRTGPSSSLLGGCIYHSLDGGTSWQREVLLDAQNFYSPLWGMSFTDRAHGWATGGNETVGLLAVYKPTPVVRVESSTELPFGFEVFQNYPNPFNPPRERCCKAGGGQLPGSGYRHPG